MSFNSGDTIYLIIGNLHPMKFTRIGGSNYLMHEIKSNDRNHFASRSELLKYDFLSNNITSVSFAADSKSYFTVYSLKSIRPDQKSLYQWKEESWCISFLQARFACLRCAAGGHFVSAGGALRSPGGDIG